MLVPIEHLTPHGMSAVFARIAADRAAWSAERIALFDAGFARYWARGSALARRTRTWPAPRRRHVAVVVGDPLSVRPYAQLLNTSAWLLYGSDLDPVASHPELLAWLLVLGDRMAVSGVVSHAPVQAALWWLERSDEECAAFTAAARRSARPDAEGLRAVADALDWLRRLHHDPLHPPATTLRHRRIPESGLLVPPALAANPPALASTCEHVATDVLGRYRAAQQGPNGAALDELAGWLVAGAPPLLVTRSGRIVWDAAHADRVNGLRRALKGAPRSAVDGVRLDLTAVARVTRAFEAAVADPSALPPAAPGYTVESGYTFLHRERRMIAYDLEEPGIERTAGPALPYARLMLAARTAHEWAHLADAAAWVPRVVSDEEWCTRRDALGVALEDVVREAPAAIRTETAADLRALAVEQPLGRALVRVLVSRLPDYRANLIARHVLAPEERETYVRQNVRALRQEYAPAQRWRLLLRYLFEYQYLQPALGMSLVPDPHEFFVTSTWFDEDFFATDILDAARFTALAEAMGGLCTAYAVDRTRLRFA